MNIVKEKVCLQLVDLSWVFSWVDLYFKTYICTDWHFSEHSTAQRLQDITPDKFLFMIHGHLGNNLPDPGTLGRISFSDILKINGGGVRKWGFLPSLYQWHTLIACQHMDTRTRDKGRLSLFTAHPLCPAEAYQRHILIACKQMDTRTRDKGRLPLFTTHPLCPVEAYQRLDTQSFW